MFARAPSVRAAHLPLTLIAGLAFAVHMAGCSSLDDDSEVEDSRLVGPAPNAEYCDQVADWDPEFEAWEFEVLEIVNQRRSEGANCGSGGTFGPAGDVVMQTQLRCAARAHSMDMIERDYFDHTDPDGNGPQVRIDASGYSWSGFGENIAYGYPDPDAVMEGWMSSDGHCSNIMGPNFEEIGIGAYAGDDGALMWTQVFGRPG